MPKDALDTYINDGKIRFTGVGTNIPTRLDTELDIEGRWVTDKRYGKQLSIKSHAEILPQTIDGIIGYLSSSLFKGIGPKTAELIVVNFGLKTLDVLEREPDLLLQVKGITPEKLIHITESFKDTRSVQQLVSYLTPYGISVKKAMKIYDEYGLKSMDMVLHDPYSMCEIHGFGFITVDFIAQSTTCSSNDPKRIRGAIKYVLDDAAGSGHLFLMKDQLVRKAKKALNTPPKKKGDEEPEPKNAVSKKKTILVTELEIKDQVNALVSDKSLKHEEGALYLPRLYDYEVAIAKSVFSMIAIKPPTINLDSSIARAQKTLNITLSDKQIAAVKMSLNHTLSVITGGPGTGKTTVLMVILHIYREIYCGTVMLAAPTGRASRKMSESTGFEAQTLHSALGLVVDEDNGFANSSSPLEADFVVVDETSMLDCRVGNELFTRLRPGTKLLVVGDADQLPPVGAGKILRDLIECGEVPVTRLDVVFRQALDSNIPINAKRIRDGLSRLIEGNDFQFLDADTPAEAAQLIYAEYKKAADTVGVSNVQILSPYKKPGVDCGVYNMNRDIQELVNPAARGKKEIKDGARVFRLGDKVIQNKNKQNISNGDVGKIIKFSLSAHNEPSIIVEFTGGRLENYEKDELDVLDLAYATTVHKAQGSEYSIVIIPVLYSFYVMLQRDIYYTGITRAKKKVILVGQRDAFTQAIRTEPMVRNTRLAKRIKDMCAEYRRLRKIA